MSSAKIYIGQDVQFTLETGVDISSATTLQIRGQRPDLHRTVVTKTASVVTSTKARATFEDTDLDTVGVWKFQVYAVIDSAIRFGATFPYTVTALYDNKG